jgi:hypothetical protein
VSRKGWDRSSKGSELPETYYLSGPDRVVIAAAIELLTKIVRSPFIRPSQLISAAKALHVIGKLPQVTKQAVNVQVSLSGPRRWFGQRQIWHWWTVEVAGHRVRVESAGIVHQESSGQESGGANPFTCLQWSLEPGAASESKDFLGELQGIDDAQPFPDEIAALNLSEGGFTLDVEDEHNHFLEVPGEEDEDQSWDEPESAGPARTEAEQRLAALADEAEGLRRNLNWLVRGNKCEVCGGDLNSSEFMVDGQVRGGPITFSCMCPDCFIDKGDKVAWGSGQLYRRLPDGAWMMVGGFPPEN